MGAFDIWLTRVRAVPAKECRHCARLGGSGIDDPKVAASLRGPRRLSWQAEPCQAARFGMRQGRAALLPLNRSGHGLIPVTYPFFAAMHAFRTRYPRCDSSQ